MNHKKVLFPGSFDPFTKGHEAIVKKALTLFDDVVVAIGKNTTKKSFFTLESKVNHIETTLNDPRVKVIEFSGLTVDACIREQCSFILRGLRDTKDFQYERSIAHMNSDLKGIETLFLLTELQYSAINSSIVREILISGGNIESFVTNPEKLIINRQ